VHKEKRIPEKRIYQKHIESSGLRNQTRIKKKRKQSNINVPRTMIEQNSMLFPSQQERKKEIHPIKISTRED
jgi:hypothetical protein